MFSISQSLRGSANFALMAIGLACVVGVASKRSEAESGIRETSTAREEVATPAPSETAGQDSPSDDYLRKKNELDSAKAKAQGAAGAGTAQPAQAKPGKVDRDAP